MLIGDRKNRTSIVSTDDLARIVVDSVTVEAEERSHFTSRWTRNFMA